MPQNIRKTGANFENKWILHVHLIHIKAHSIMWIKRMKNKKNSQYSITTTLLIKGQQKLIIKNLY